MYGGGCGNEKETEEEISTLFQQTLKRGLPSRVMVKDFSCRVRWTQVSKLAQALTNLCDFGHVCQTQLYNMHIEKDNSV